MILSYGLDGIAAATSLALRYTSILFVRFHPIGKKYIVQLNSLFVAYCVAAIAQLLNARRFREKKRRQFWLSILILGLTDVSRPLLTALTWVVNILCFLSTLDFLYRGHYFHQSHDLSFSRTGYVDGTSARIVLRAPETEAVEIQVFDSNSPDMIVTRKVVDIRVDSDHTGTAVISGLNPLTKYQYSTNASHSGSFRTFPRANARSGRWSMVTTSCIKPFYPYNPLDHGLRIRGLEYLDTHLKKQPADMMLFLGDFIYVDLPVPLGWDYNAYTSLYRQVYASPSWTPASRNLPWIHVYDDHEIINDWAGNDTGLYKTAMQPFWSYQGQANPTSQFGQDKTYYKFRREGVAFFVLDTRRYRSSNAMPDGPDKTMLGKDQLTALLKWISSESQWKVIVSSVPFTRNWRGPDSADSWSGFIYERDIILSAMKKHGGGIILSGDRHEHATTLFPAEGAREKDVIEFSTSPLNQFFEPFDRFHREVEESDRSIFSYPWGTSKFGVISFDTTTQSRLRIHYDLVVDGQKVWEYDWGMEK